MGDSDRDCRSPDSSSLSSSPPPEPAAPLHPSMIGSAMTSSLNSPVATLGSPFPVISSSMGSPGLPATPSIAYGPVSSPQLGRRETPAGPAPRVLSPPWRRRRRRFGQAPLRHLRRPVLRKTLRRVQLRGLQGLLQAHHPQRPHLHVPRQQGLRGGQAPTQPLPVLPLPKVLGHRHETGSGAGGTATRQGEGRRRRAGRQRQRGDARGEDLGSRVGRRTEIGPKRGRFRHRRQLGRGQAALHAGGMGQADPALFRAAFGRPSDPAAGGTASCWPPASTCTATAPTAPAWAPSSTECSPSWSPRCATCAWTRRSWAASAPSSSSIPTLRVFPTPARWSCCARRFTRPSNPTASRNTRSSKAGSPSCCSACRRCAPSASNASSTSSSSSSSATPPSTPSSWRCSKPLTSSPEPPPGLFWGGGGA
ncbi:retinoic acid receptor RXR-beta isoform X3 [Apteryx mantelli]|uniref:Retinoic acid receptor RXR-beta isoform X3 n=1 Tax=Apteryx mantelli TaxID=2696672 RepID=A0ABM4FY51_9AVES